MKRELEPLPDRDRRSARLDSAPDGVATFTGPELEPFSEDDPRCRLALEAANRALRDRAAAPESLATRLLPAAVPERTQHLGRLRALLLWLALQQQELVFKTHCAGAAAEGSRSGKRLGEGAAPAPDMPMQYLLSLCDLAAELLEHDFALACSAARLAVLVGAELAAAGRDCRFLCRQLAGLFKQVAGEAIFANLHDDAEACLAVGWELASAGGGEPALLAGLTLEQAQLHFQRGETQECLTELEVARMYCDLAEDGGPIAIAWYLTGLCLATLRQSAAAREAFQKSLGLLTGSEPAWLAEAVQRQLAMLVGER